jgi:ribonuclease P protein component
MSQDQRFRPTDRLRKPADFERVFQRRCSIQGKTLLIYGCANDQGRTRLGRVVAKRGITAVQRNLLRRWLSEAFRQVKSDLPPGIDLIVKPLTVEGLDFRNISEELPLLVAKLADRLKSAP